MIALLALAAWAADPRALVDTWTLVLPPEQARERDLYRFALAEPLPTAEQLERLQPTEDQLTLLLQLLQWRQEDPDDPRLAKARAALDDLGTATLEISGRKAVYRLGKAKERYRWAVLAADGDTLTLALERKGAGFTSTAVLDGDVLHITLPPMVPGELDRRATFQRLREPPR